MLVVRSGDMSIPVSYRLVGFGRIAKPLEEYGASMPKVDAPAHRPSVTGGELNDAR
jgi:hypothetical protein